MVIEQAISRGNGGGSGSVGAVGRLSYDERNKRVKGMFSQLITTKDAVERLVSRVSDQESRHPSATRTTFRAFVQKGLLEGIQKDSLAGYNVEAVVPADRAVPGFDIVYFGRNHESRMPDGATLAAEGANLRWVLENVSAVGREHAFARAQNGGYSISLGAGEGDVRTLLNLYSQAYQKYTFEIDENAISYMLGNGNKTFVARNSSGSIASILIAEECVVNLENGSQARLFELSDFATFGEDRKNGLITALQIRAIDFLRSLDPRAIIYAEDRAPWTPVLKSSREAGMAFAGTLPFHCGLVSDRTFDYQVNHDYETLQVFYAK